MINEIDDLVKGFGGTVLNPAKTALSQPESSVQDDDISSLVSSFGGQVIQPEKQPITVSETAGRAVKGGAGGTAGFLDFILSAPQPKEDAYSISPQSQSIPNKEWVEAEYNKVNPELRNLIESKYHEITGFPVREKGESVVGDIIETGADILSPGIPGTGVFRGINKAVNGIKGAAKVVGKNLTKDVPMAVGAATALHATPDITDEDSDYRGVEDFAKMIAGSVVGSKADKIGKSIKNMPSYLASVGSNVNENVIALAKKHGIKLPFNVGMDSKAQNFLANNYLKSMFVSDAYKEALKASDESMVNAVKKSIDSLGDSKLTPKPASDEYLSFISNREKQIQKQASELYENAYSLVNNTETVNTKNTSDFIYSLKELLNRDIKSASTKRVASIIGELAESWGITPPIKDLQNISDDPVFLNKMLEAFKSKGNNIPLEKLIGVKKELGLITGYDKDLKGVENLLNGLSGAIAKDIESSSNKSFTSALKEANKFFKDEIGDVFRTDFARSLLSGEAPVEAFNKMNSVENIKMLKKIAGESEKGTELFNSLAKAKVREIFSNSINEDSLQTGAFSKIMDKKEKTWDLLKELMGETEFNNLKELGTIAMEYSKAGRDLLNTSGTAIAHSDIQKLEGLIKGTFGAVKDSISSVGSAGIGYAAGGLPGAAIGIATPNLASRLFANDKFVENMRDYAIARKAGKNAKAEKILKRVVKTMHDVESGGRIEKTAIVREKERKDKKKEPKKFGDSIRNDKK